MIERLTERDEHGDIYVKEHDYVAAAKRLAEYEDEGLEPYHIKSILGNVHSLVELCRKIKKENAKLKRMLKLAVEDAKALFEACEKEYMRHDSFIEPEMCKFCKYYRTGFCKCEPEGRCRWRYADEVKGLIENGNELDSGV